MVDGFVKTNGHLGLWIPGSRFARPGMTSRCDNFSTTGKSAPKPNQARRAKNNSVYKNSDFRHKLAISCPPRGASRSSRNVGQGMRWTQPASARVFAGRNRRQRTAKSCGPGAATVASSWREVSRRRRWQETPLHRGEHEEAVKPSRGESRDELAEPVVTTLVCFFILQTRLRVRSAPGFPCALCFGEGR